MLRPTGQGQLFDAPFMYSSSHHGGRESGSGGGGGRGDAYYTDDNVDQVVYTSGLPETTPLRRRENDSFAAPVYNNSNQRQQPQHHYYSSDTGGTGTGPSRPMYPQQPQLFPPRKRKQQQSQFRFSDPETWIKLAMRAILLSPVVVLIVWSIAAISFSNRHVLTQQQQQLGTTHSSSTSASSSSIHTNNNKNAKNDAHHQQKNVHWPNRYSNNKNKNDKNRVHQAQDWLSNHLVHPNSFGSSSNNNDNVADGNGLLPLPVLGASEELKKQSPIIMGGSAPLIVQPQFFPPQQQGTYYYNNLPDEQAFRAYPQQQQPFQDNTNTYNYNYQQALSDQQQQQRQMYGDGMNQIVPPLQYNQGQQQQPLQSIQYGDQSTMQYYQDDVVSQQVQGQLGNKNAFFDSFQQPPVKSQLRQPNRMRLSNYLPQFVTRGFQKQQRLNPAFGMIPADPQQQYPILNSPRLEQLEAPYMGQQQNGYDSSQQLQQQLLQHHQDYATEQQGNPATAAAMPQLQQIEEPKVVDHQLLGRAMDKHHTYLRNGKVKGGVRYYFYDPRSTIRKQDGSLYLPSVVYDVHGKPISIHSLSSSASNANQIYMEPPRGSSMNYLYSNYSFSNSSNTTLYNSTLAPTSTDTTETTNTTNNTMANYTWVHPNVVHTPVHDRKKGIVAMSEMRIPEWGDSTSYDSSIIICTVGVMALLVGAISARRMRSRSVLSMCIENESLEDDIAYDTAYTVSAGDTNQYHTFNNQGWKGDLEKFDV